MKNKQQAVVFGIIILIIFGIVSFFLTRNANYQSDSIINIGTTTDISNSDYKTYTDKDNGFSFNYPKDWVSVGNGFMDLAKVESPDRISNGAGKTISAHSFSFNLIRNDSFGERGTKMGDVIYDKDKGTLVDIASDPARCLPVRNFGNTPVIEYNGSMMSDPAHFESVILTNKDFMISVQELSEQSDNNVARNLIFSSFHFVNDTKIINPECNGVGEQVSTADWKKFSNPGLNYEIKYPSNWIINTGKDLGSVGITNPSRQGKPNTDQPAESIGIVYTGEQCKDADWKIGFADIFYKFVCKGSSKKVQISMTAFDEESVQTEEAIVNTFVFK